MTTQIIGVLRFGDIISDDRLDLAPGVKPERLLWLLDAAREQVAEVIANQTHTPTDRSLDFGIRIPT